MVLNGCFTLCIIASFFFKVPYIQIFKRIYNNISLNVCQHHSDALQSLDS